MFATPINRREMLALTASIGLAAAAAARPKGPKPPSPYAARVLSLKPAGYWRLGEAAGPTARDSSGHHHHGTFKGTPIFGAPGAIANDHDTSLALAGKSYVEVPDTKHFSVGEAGLTVEVWLRLHELDFPGQTGAGDDPYVHWLGKGEKDQFEWGFRMYSKHKKDGGVSGRPNRISAYAWNPKSATSGPNEGAGAYFQDELAPHHWLHVVAVYEPPGPGAGVRIYRDGKLRKGPPDHATLYSAYDVTPAHGSAPLRLGTRDLGSLLSGGLDEVAIYPRVLTPAEIAENHRVGRHGEARK